MNKDEALELALDALENHEGNYKLSDAGCDRHDEAITAIKQALAAQQEQEPEIVRRVKRYAGQTMRTARNPNITARECIELANWIAGGPPAAQPVPVQEPFDHQQAASTALRESMNRSVAIAKNTVPTLQKRPPNCRTGHCSCVECVMEPAPVQPVACQVCGGSGFIKCDALQSREKNNGKWGRCLNCQPYTNPPAQPAVPDAIHHTDLSESLEYIQGWNDCRQAMLEMMK